MKGIRGVHERYRSRFKILGGSDFYGQILDIPDTSRVTNFLSPKRYLRTGPFSPVKPGDVVVLFGVMYIVGEHGTGFLIAPLYKQFKMLQVDIELPWERNTDVVDTVTGVVKSGARTSLGTAYISLDTKNDIEDALNIQTERRLFVTDKDVAVEDYLGDFIVTKVDKLIGLSVCEVKDTE